MKKIIIYFVLASCSVFHPLNGQVLPVGSSGAATTKPELDQLAADYEAKEKELDAEIEPQLKAARERYAADLEALAAKFNQAKRPDEGDKVRHESKRFLEHGLNGEPAKTAPAEVRAAWATFLRATVTAAQSVALKRNSLRSKFGQNLTTMDQAYRAKNDVVGMSLARRARAGIAIRNAIDGNRLGVTEVVGKGRGQWQEVAQEGGYLVGFEAGQGGWFQFKVLGGLKPIFATARGPRDGERRGKAGGTRVVAKDGYAVGGLIVRSGEVVNAVQVIFTRINADGITLNPQDFYVTDWLGGEGGIKPKEINTKGHLVVGVTGSTGDVVDSIGLIFLK